MGDKQQELADLITELQEVGKSFWSANALRGQQINLIAQRLVVLTSPASGAAPQLLSDDRLREILNDWCEDKDYSLADVRRDLALAAPDTGKRPKVVCLCGSTRFYEMFQRANYLETMAGNIVLSVGFYPHAQAEVHHEEIGCTAEQKIALDELHKRKIDLADEVYVLNVGGYIGSSTRSEIEYAVAHDKPIRYLELRAALEAAAAPSVTQQQGAK